MNLAQRWQRIVICADGGCPVTINLDTYPVRTATHHGRESQIEEVIKQLKAHHELAGTRPDRARDGIAAIINFLGLVPLLGVYVPGTLPQPVPPDIAEQIEQLKRDHEVHVGQIRQTYERQLQTQGEVFAEQMKALTSRQMPPTAAPDPTLQIRLRAAETRAAELAARVDDLTRQREAAGQGQGEALITLEQRLRTQHAAQFQQTQNDLEQCRLKNRQLAKENELLRDANEQLKRRLRGPTPPPADNGGLLL